MAGLGEGSGGPTQSNLGPALPLLAHLLAERQPAHRLIISTCGLVISGEVVTLQTWRQATEDLGADLQEIIVSATAAEKEQADAAESPRLIYLRERLRWGSGLTPAQAKELQAEQAAVARRQDFLYLVNVTLESGAGAISVPRWCLPFDKVDGFCLVSGMRNTEEENDRS